MKCFVLSMNLRILDRCCEFLKASGLTTKDAGGRWEKKRHLERRVFCRFLRPIGYEQHFNFNTCYWLLYTILLISVSGNEKLLIKIDFYY